MREGLKTPPLGRSVVADSRLSPNLFAAMRRSTAETRKIACWIWIGYSCPEMEWSIMFDVFIFRSFLLGIAGIGDAQLICALNPVKANRFGKKERKERREGLKTPPWCNGSGQAAKTVDFYACFRWERTFHTSEKLPLVLPQKIPNPILSQTKSNHSEKSRFLAILRHLFSTCEK